MRRFVLGPVCLALSLVAASACTDATGPAASLTLTRAPDFSARVSKTEFESADGPAGPYAQYDLWVAIPPASTANAGVVLPTKAPVFVSRDGRLATARASDVRVGDEVQVWRAANSVAYGAVQGPPNAPTYEGTQLVIVR